MKISEITKRNIFDELKLNNINWHGRLNEIDFLSRIFDLDNLSSSDSRFKNMRDDIWQHRINNIDWNDWWIIDDSRLDLLNNDENFLKFLCQIVHPVIRKDDKEISLILDIVNGYLAADGWKLIEESRISGKPIFKAINYKKDIDFKNENNISQEFAKNQISKCMEKINKKDYDGAISNARSFIEGVIVDIFQRITGEKLELSGDLPDKYKKIKNLLKLSPEQSTDKEMKALCSGILTIMHALDQISNKMGDRHVPLTQPEEYHARFYVNACKIIADFLYERLNDLYQSKENLFNGIISILNKGRNRMLTREELINDQAIKNILDKCDNYVSNLLKNKFIDDYLINNFRENDIFFAGMRIFFDYLTKYDVKKIFLKCKDNDQTLPPFGGLIAFLESIRKEKPDLLNNDIELFLDKFKNDF